MSLKKAEILLAQQGLKTIQAQRKKSQSGARLMIGTQGEILLPPQAMQALSKALTHLAAGNEVVVEVRTDELTTQQAANFLRVSRPFLVGLLEKGQLPFRKVGSHRRVLLSDLESYKQRIDEQRLQALAQLAAQAQELGMGY
jgi:excisionase family DNA binding protein